MVKPRCCPRTRTCPLNYQWYIVLYSPTRNAFIPHSNPLLGYFVSSNGISNRQNKVKYEGIERSEIPEWSYEDWNEELVEL